MAMKQSRGTINYSMRTVNWPDRVCHGRAVVLGGFEKIIVKLGPPPKALLGDGVYFIAGYVGRSRFA
jgi:hypothetical protein